MIYFPVSLLDDLKTSRFGLPSTEFLIRLANLPSSLAY